MQDFDRGEPRKFFDKRAMFLKKSKDTVREALKSRDMLLSGVTKTIVDLDQIINMLGERLEHWYEIYFPEIYMEDKVKYAQAVLAIDRQNPNEEQLSALFGPKKAQEIIDKSKTSLGANLAIEDLEKCRALADEIISMKELKNNLEDYQKDLAGQICPNLTALAGAEIAARMLAHIGSLKRLAILPASTLQVIGAENSLFKHLKNRRIPPPKHGIIFQHPKISSSPKAVRGKIARALSNKMALALKADAYTKNDLSKMLIEGFEKRVSQIMKDYERNKNKPKKFPEQQMQPQTQYREDRDEPPRERRPFQQNNRRDFERAPPREDRYSGDRDRAPPRPQQSQYRDREGDRERRPFPPSRDRYSAPAPAQSSSQYRDRREDTRERGSYPPQNRDRGSPYGRDRDDSDNRSGGSYSGRRRDNRRRDRPRY
ncbi:NOP58 family protein [Candidatus Micrarchaeota archaeon]|nr:NOP58 family protein [Candidatus Micrarchaeota archaeon]